MRLGVLAVLGIQAACAQEPEEGLALLTSILDTPIVAANLQFTPIRESPGIGGNPPLPGPGREVALDLSFHP